MLFLSIRCIISLNSVYVRFQSLKFFLNPSQVFLFFSNCGCIRFDGLTRRHFKILKIARTLQMGSIALPLGHHDDRAALKLEDHWSCSSPERLSHCKLMRFKLIENRPMKVYAWTLLTPGAWPNLTQGHDWHNL